MSIVLDIAPWIIVIALAWFVFQLVLQNGRILLAVEGLEQRFAQMVSQPEPQGLAVGTDAPAFTLATLDGGQVSLEDYRGRRVVLIFFSTNCGYCLNMAPTLAGLPADGPADRPVPLILTSGEAEENRQLWIEEHKITSPILLDGDQDIFAKYEASGTPTGYLINEDGKIATPLTVGADDLLALVNQEAGGDDTSGNGGAPSTAESSAPAGTGSASAGASGPTRTFRVPVRILPEEGIGVGDLVKRMTDAMGIKACQSCERRRVAWNRWVIRGRRFTPAPQQISRT